VYHTLFRCGFVVSGIQECQRKWPVDCAPTLPMSFVWPQPRSTLSFLPPPSKPSHPPGGRRVVSSSTVTYACVTRSRSIRYDLFSIRFITGSALDNTLIRGGVVNISPTSRGRLSDHPSLSGHYLDSVFIPSK
jgi:hypothetical protein